VYVLRIVEAVLCLVAALRCRLAHCCERDAERRDIHTWKLRAVRATWLLHAVVCMDHDANDLESDARPTCADVAQIACCRALFAAVVFVCRSEGVAGSFSAH
jgi:hypothetical protein